MYFSLVAISYAALACIPVSAAPTAGGNVYPLPDGFPNPNPEQVKEIEQAALGTLSNSTPPASISPGGVTSLQLIAFNELFEVDYFTKLLTNITGGVKGFEIEDEGQKDFVVRSLKAIQAQEQLHALAANNALVHFGHEAILPCKYDYPVSTFDEAISLAGTFTSVVLGTLQDVIHIFAKGGDSGLARETTSVVGQEGEQEGWFRILQNKIPSELPFLTTSVLDLAFTAIQSFTVPGSCPNMNLINLRTFKPLTLVAPPPPEDTTVQFTVEEEGYNPGLWVTYINQQNVPIVEKQQAVGTKDGKVTIEAKFPFVEHMLNGLTLAVLTTSAGPFVDANAAVNQTVFGPAIIIMN
ncbi:hypothetical protein FQN53_008555 [Emmonsiellopsis sp. PD_33]|nr:hypothetical protein FQN53_008555 [Emmonsiellopsis sp. PD_33]